jgi:ribosome-binding protein aMBF1 (putative translation factor)
VAHRPVTYRPVIYRPLTQNPVNDKPWTDDRLTRNVGRVALKMDVLARFGQRVREKRTTIGLSQEAFADKCKLDRTYISGIERGKRNLSLRNIEVIAKTIGISISELMEGV